MLAAFVDSGRGRSRVKNIALQLMWRHFRFSIKIDPCIISLYYIHHATTSNLVVINVGIGSCRLPEVEKLSDPLPLLLSLPASTKSSWLTGIFSHTARSIPTYSAFEYFDAAAVRKHTARRSHSTAAPVRNSRRTAHSPPPPPPPPSPPPTPKRHRRPRQQQQWT